MKHELHNLSMGAHSMTEYLSKIKGKVDLIAASWLLIPAEDVTYYTLNGLPASYNDFKTSIRTNLQPISLDDLYSLLCSEEVLLSHENSKQD